MDSTDTINKRSDRVIKCLFNEVHLCTKKPGQKTLSQETASKTVAAEFMEDWIVKNVYALHVNNVAKKFRTDYQRFIKFHKK